MSRGILLLRVATAVGVGCGAVALYGLSTSGEDRWGPETLATVDTVAEVGTVTTIEPAAQTPPVVVTQPKPLGEWTDDELALLFEADAAVVDGQLDDASELYDELADVRRGDSDVARRQEVLEVYQEQQATAVEWTEPVPHLFVHSLIDDTSLAFDGDYTDKGYRLYMVTKTEFTRIIEQMYERDYIMVNIGALFDEDANGQISPGTVMVPPGKKPFILSIDDINYYDYMAGDGFAHHLEIDAKGNVATRMGPEPGTPLTLDGDVVPVLDQFILEHPDFSYLGAKGVLAVTGYEGVLGYRTQADQVNSPDFDDRVAAATAVAERLKGTGWTFANHSYTHGQALKNKTISYEGYKSDLKKWHDEVQPIVGATDIYISPFGYYLPNDDPRYRYLIEEAGYNMFNNIYNGVSMLWRDDNVVHERLTVDGYMFRNRPDALEPYFDVATVWDDARGEYTTADG